MLGFKCLITGVCLQYNDMYAAADLYEGGGVYIVNANTSSGGHVMWMHYPTNERIIRVFDPRGLFERRGVFVLKWNVVQFSKEAKEYLKQEKEGEEE